MSCGRPDFGSASMELPAARIVRDRIDSRLVDEPFVLHTGGEPGTLELARERGQGACSELERDVEIIGEPRHAVERDGLRSEHVPPDPVAVCHLGERGDRVVQRGRRPGRAGPFSRAPARSGRAFRSLLQAHSPMATPAPTDERATVADPSSRGSQQSRRVCAGALPRHRARPARPSACPPARRRSRDRLASRAQDTPSHVEALQAENTPP